MNHHTFNSVKGHNFDKSLTIYQLPLTQKLKKEGDIALVVVDTYWRPISNYKRKFSIHKPKHNTEPSTTFHFAESS